MSKRIFLYLSLLSALFCACQSEHERQTAMLHELLDACERYDTMPNDSLARSVLYYMERHGSPAEQQQAWRMMAKMYKRHGSLFGEDFAYQMAIDCVDSTSTDFDTLAVAEILSEWCINQSYSTNYDYWQIADSAKTLAKAAGDSVAYYRYMSLGAYVSMDIFYRTQPHPDYDSFKQTLADAETAYHKLWQMGHKDLSVDAFFPIIAFYNNGSKADSIAKWLDRYARYTHQDIRHAESLAAVEYFLQKGDFFKYQEQIDSALFYYQKLVNQSKNYVKGIGYGRIYNLYRTFSQEDSTYKYRILYNNLYVQNYFKVQKDKFLENEDEWRQRNEFITNELELQRKSTTLIYILVIVLLVCAFIVYRYFMLRTRHRETLDQNREYADMLHSLKQRTQPSILDTEIARKFHELSSQDSHPTAEDWQALRDEIDRKHPQLFATLQQQYAEHQPDQTLTEQERHVISLIAIRCSPLQMSVLLVTSKPNVSNIRRRLFNKLTGKDGSSTDLDQYVAGLCEE